MDTRPTFVLSVALPMLTAAILTAAPGAAQERTSRTSIARSATTALEFATAQIMTSIAGLSHDAAMAVIQNMQ